MNRPGFSRGSILETMERWHGTTGIGWVAERADRTASDHRADYDSEQGPLRAIADDIACSAEALRTWRMPFYPLRFAALDFSYPPHDYLIQKEKMVTRARFERAFPSHGGGGECVPEDGNGCRIPNP